MRHLPLCPTFMVALLTLTTLTSAVCLTGCGGYEGGGVRTRVYTLPDGATLAPRQEQVFAVGVTEVSLEPSTVEWQVLEGDAGGTVRYAREPTVDDGGSYRLRVLYTAPSKTGTYHLRWQGDEKLRSTVTISVKNP